MSDSLSRLVEAVRSAGVDIAPGYCEYVRLAFAIANDCGEAGRSLFHRICRISEKYVSTRRTDSSTTPSKGVTGETESGLSITGQRPLA